MEKEMVARWENYWLLDACFKGQNATILNQKGQNDYVFKITSEMQSAPSQIMKLLSERYSCGLSMNLSGLLDPIYSSW